MEIWKTIEGYEDYKVSSFGKVKSLERFIDRSDNTKQHIKERILKYGISNSGYFHVVITKDKKRKTIYVHKLVAMAFLNHMPIGKEIVIDHVDNNKLNNNLYNLQIITARENLSKDKKECSSKYTGVYLHKTTNKWVSNIRINGIKKHIGYFENELDASNAYKKVLSEIIKNKELEIKM